MSVLCEGDPWITYQLGVKQDLEAQLSHAGFKHENFTLHVRRINTPGARTAWRSTFVVRVTNTATGKFNCYCGGPEHCWTEPFVRDVELGTFGEAATRQRTAALG
jgi:hypothetical protein